MNHEKINILINNLRVLGTFFEKKYKVNDIYSNSKIYEVLIANRFNHITIPGHSGSRDAMDSDGNEIEYKHFKESSSNHTWTFNDFSDTTLSKLKTLPYAYFVYVDDVNFEFPGQVKWYYKVKGIDISDFLVEATKKIKNARKMINVSVRNLESIGEKKIVLQNFNIEEGSYGEVLTKIVKTIRILEKETNSHGLLTSNKLWELMLAIELKHNLNSEQGGREGAHDAYDDEGKLYEYKISKNHSWNFQDISDNVLNKYLTDNAIILAVVDKQKMIITNVYSVNPISTVYLLRKKLHEKTTRFQNQNKSLRRLQVSLTKSDLKNLDAIKIL